MAKIIGTAPNQVPVNGNLGNLAYQDAANIAGNVGVGGSVTATSGVINANTTATAFRITQVGTGNALVVEDSANPDATPFVVDSAGNVVVGNLTPIATSQWFGTTYFTPRQQIIGSANGASVGLFSFSSSSSSSAQLNIGKSASNTLLTNTVVVNGEDLGAVNWQGADGTNYINAARISAAVDGTPGTNDMPGRLVFSTTADGASTPTERMRIDNAGNVGVGVTPVARLDLNGNQASNIVAVAALDINCSLGNFFTKTINGASTFTFSTVPASRAFGFTLELTHTSGAVTWPASVAWPANTAPTLTTGKTHLFMFVTDDGGTRWRGASLVDYTT